MAVSLIGLFKDGDTYTIGSMTAQVMHTPGHTPACNVHLIGDAAFVGDTLFMPDGGSARCDFPGGSAEQLYDSIQRILALPDETRLYMCHDYGPGGREISWETTVRDERTENIHVGNGKNQGRVRRVPHGPRRATGHAQADRSVLASEHEGGKPAASRRHWSSVL